MTIVQENLNKDKILKLTLNINYKFIISDNLVL